MAKKFYAQIDGDGYPIPGTLQSTTLGAVPANTLEIPAQEQLTSPENVRSAKMRYYVRHDKNGNIIPNSLIASIKRPKGLVYEFQPAR